MRMSSPRLVLAALAFFPAALLAACSAAPAPQSPPPPSAPGQAGAYQQQAGYPAASASPTAPGQYPGAVGALTSAWANLPPPTDVPAGLAQLDAAEQALALVLPSSRPGNATAPGDQATPDRNADPLALDQACTIACTALASMKRSADHVCTMAGDKDAVCGNARERVSRAEARVTAACPACAK